MEFLRAALADEERPATEVLTEATVLGVAEMTLRRARKALSVRVRRQGFGKDGRFLLVLPSNDTDPADGAGKPNGVGNGLDHEDAGLTTPSGFPVSERRRRPPLIRGEPGALCPIGAPPRPLHCHRPPRRQRSGESAAAVHVRTTHGEPDAPCCCPPSSPSRTAWVPPPDVHLDGSTTPVGASVPDSVAPRRLGGRGALGPLRPPAA